MTETANASGAVGRVLARLGVGPSGTPRVPTTLEIETQIRTLLDLLDRQTPARQRLIWCKIDTLLEVWPIAACWQSERSAP